MKIKKWTTPKLSINQHTSQPILGISCVPTLQQLVTPPAVSPKHPVRHHVCSMAAAPGRAGNWTPVLMIQAWCLTSLDVYFWATENLSVFRLASRSLIASTLFRSPFFAKSGKLTMLLDVKLIRSQERNLGGLGNDSVSFSIRMIGPCVSRVCTIPGSILKVSDFVTMVKSSNRIFMIRTHHRQTRLRTSWSCNPAGSRS